MNILYIGCYRDATGYGQMALNSIMALITAGANVTARPVKLNNSRMTLPPQVVEAESNPNRSFDAVIQNVLPHSMEYTGKIPLNVGYYCTETTRFDDTIWPQKINTMDRAWVCNRQSSFASEDSGVDIPIDVIPIAANVSKYQRSYNNLSIRDRFPDSFIFYYIGEFNARKNIRALLQAFHLEFDPNEPVELVLKSKVGSVIQSPSQQLSNHQGMLEDIRLIKHNMRLYDSTDDYKKEILLSNHFTEEEVMRLHSSCDCFVCPSHGEAWCIPAFDAMSMGKTPIVSNDGGFRDYMSNERGYLVGGVWGPAFGMTKDTFDGMYTSKENWFEVSIGELRKAMRTAYQHQDVRKKLALAGRKHAYDFSYAKVGQEMIKALSCQTK